MDFEEVLIIISISALFEELKVIRLLLALSSAGYNNLGYVDG